jgi:hypothetical protein
MVTFISCAARISPCTVSLKIPFRYAALGHTWVRKALVEIPHQMHWNSFRFCIGPVPDRWLRSPTRLVCSV